MPLNHVMALQGTGMCLSADLLEGQNHKGPALLIRCNSLAGLSGKDLLQDPCRGTAILALGSALMSENALEQAWGRFCCSPGCYREQERSWQGEGLMENYSCSLASELRQTSPTVSTASTSAERHAEQPALPRAWPPEPRAGCQELLGLYIAGLFISKENTGREQWWICL